MSKDSYKDPGGEESALPTFPLPSLCASLPEAPSLSFSQHPSILPSLPLSLSPSLNSSLPLFCPLSLPHPSLPLSLPPLTHLRPVESGWDGPFGGASKPPLFFPLSLSPTLPLSLSPFHHWPLSYQ